MGEREFWVMLHGMEAIVGTFLNYEQAFVMWCLIFLNSENSFYIRTFFLDEPIDRFSELRACRFYHLLKDP